MPTNTSLVQRQPAWLNWLFALFMALMLAATLAPNKAHAAPAAGSSIGNVASATYTDASAVARTATSNTVTTVVQQVAALTLASSQSLIVAAGGTVYFPHTLTNTGNGSDTFGLTAVDANTGAITFTGLVMYPDADGNGVPDGPAITSTGPLAAGAQFKFLVAASVGAVADGLVETITVTATSGFTPATTALNTDTVTVSGNAVINVTKSMSATSGAAGSGPYTITLTYINSGNNTATDVALFDALPSGMSYVAGSGLASITGATVLTDAAGNVQGGVADYTANTVTLGAHTVSARIASVGVGVSGTVSFQVNISATALAGALPATANTAKFCYDNNGATAGGATPGTCDPLTPASVNTNGSSTNTVAFSVNATPAVTIRDTGVSDAPLAQSDADVTINDVALVNSAVQGATVSFKSVVLNGGNFADSFTITTSGSTFPAGTTFQIFGSDGVTPLVGGVTPSLAALTGSYDIYVKATLPIGAFGPGPGLGYGVTVTATSVFAPATLDTTTDRLTTIAASTVDLRNGAANMLGTGPGAVSGVLPVTTNTVLPGATTTFVLKVNNTSLVADNYNLQASTDSSFGTLVLPSGWTVVFKADGGAGDCSAVGGTITNSGTVNASTNVTVCAQVTVPANAPATPITSPVAPAFDGTALFFRVISPGTGAFDRKLDAVIIQTVRSITLSPASQTGQVFPASTIVYAHIIANAGNVLEGDFVGEVALTLPMTGITAGWTAIVYWDKNNDGVLDAGDPAVTDLSALTAGTGGASVAAGLDPGESARLFVKVTAPATAIGDANTTTLTAATTGPINGIAAPPVVTSADGTTIIGGTVTLAKTQALDANCDGTADTVFSTANITAGAVPGACIRYQIIATNVGTTNVTSLIISDATPPNTVYDNGSRNSAGAACATGPADAPAAATFGTVGSPTALPACGATGTISVNVGTLAPSASTTITFGVMISP